MLNARQWSAEIDSTLSQRNAAQRTVILRQLTALFVAEAGALSVEHVAVFDEVMTRLIERIEHEALVELSERIAPIENAPPAVIGRLSRNDDIAVSGPVLEQSPVLTDPDLVEIAQTKSQDHLAAIAGRSTISEIVTAVLFGRGNDDVAHKVTENEGARISPITYESVVRRARNNADLSASVARRKDLPDELFEQLVREATEAVRQRLIARATPQMRRRIAEVLSDVSARVVRMPTPQTLIAGAPRSPIPLDMARLRARVMEATTAGSRADIADALAVLCQVPVKAVNDLMHQNIAEGLLILGKAGGMVQSTFRIPIALMR